MATAAPPVVINANTRVDLAGRPSDADWARLQRLLDRNNRELMAGFTAARKRPR